jgi:hypothetical protein
MAQVGDACTCTHTDYGEQASISHASLLHLFNSMSRPLLPLAAECIAVRPAILQVLFQAFCITLHSHNVKKFVLKKHARDPLSLQNKAFQLQLCELAMSLKLLDA